MKIIKKMLRVFYLFKYSNFKSSGFFKNEEVIVWIYPAHILKYFFSDKAIRDFGYITALSKHNIKHRIYIGKKIGKFRNHKILCSFDNVYNRFGFTDYVSSFIQLVENLELQGNKVFPNSYEARFWENKTFMHKEFARLSISEPKTILCKTLEEVTNIDIPFPYLIKEEHSCSSNGVHKISSSVELKTKVDSDYLNRNSTIICQELINMRKDLRVIIVDNEIVLHYWRINLANEWKPTATGFGSQVDFINFPTQWKSFIIETFKKLNLTTGAFDITWKNDDLSTIPIFLEVSPSYQPNPIVDLEKLKMDYGTFKKKFNLRINYDKEFIRLVYQIQSKVTKAFVGFKV